MNNAILAINPGSTSTKIALYKKTELAWSESIEHDRETLSKYANIYDQFEMRLELVRAALRSHGTSPDELMATVGRGGLLPPVKAGAYYVNQELIDTLRYKPVNEHASNLGAALADAIAKPLSIPAFIYDPVTVDEMEPIAKITGLKEMKRIGQGHNLNMRAAAIKYAESVEKKYKELNILVAHLGGGITLSLHSRGQIIDMISDDEGPFSPERAGGLPGFQLIKMATSGDYDYKSMMKKVQRQGGLMAYFNTSDLREVFDLADKGDEQAKLVSEAMAHNVAKNIGKLSVVTCGEIDAIVLTGGIAYSERFTGWIEKRVKFIAPVVVIPGENEMEALAMGALRVMRGEENAREFSLKV